MKAMDNKEATSMIRHKMCELAGIEFNTVIWNDGSHLNLKWTPVQRADFIDWFTDEIVKNAPFRNAVSKYPSLTKKKKWAHKLAIWFDFQYGFSLSQ